MDTIKFSCDVQELNSVDGFPLSVGVLLNGEEYFKTTPVNDTLKIEFDFPDEEDKEWKLELVVSGKTNVHTVLDEEFNIVSSTELLITNFNFDEINIDSVILTQSLPYTHNFNNTGKTVTEKFYDTVGCNGTVTLDFTTPFYFWLLENM